MWPVGCMGDLQCSKNIHGCNHPGNKCDTMPPCGSIRLCLDGGKIGSLEKKLIVYVCRKVFDVM